MVAGKKSSSHRVKGKHVAAVKKTSAKPSTPAQPNNVATVDRRESRDRRLEKDRRTQNVPVAEERRVVLERRVKVSRRRQIDPTTCERDYTPDEIEFMGALDDYKRRNGRMFPTCSEVLEVIRKLGYEKRPVVESAPLPAVVLPASTTDSVTVAG